MTTTNGTVVEMPAAAMVLHEEPRAIEPASFAELRALAKDAADSRFFGAATPQQALMVMMAGRDLGLSYTQALRAFHVIEGRPALSADGMVAVCLAHSHICEFFRVVESDDKHATVEAKRAGDPTRRLTFTLEEAQRAGLVKEKGGWAKWPGRMCLARAKSFLARELFPDLLMGMYDPEELRDSRDPAPVRVEVTPVAPISAPAIDDTVAYAAELEVKIKGAGENDELDAAAAWVARAEREEKITAEQAAALRKMGKTRRAELAK